MRFRCPHCKQRTIGAWEKLKANGLRPRQCPQCGGRNTPAAWAIVPPVLLFPFALFGPLLLASTVPWPVFWLLFALGFLLAAGIAVLTYLFAPLLRHGSRAARWELWSFVAALAALLVYAGLKPESALTALETGLTVGRPIVVQGPPARHFSDPAMQAAYKAALAKANIPYLLETQGGLEFIRVPGEHVAAAQRIAIELRGDK